MSEDSELVRLTRQARVVVFHSPVTDLGGIDTALDAAGVAWERVELGMGDATNRERFHALQAMTGRKSLPQIFVDGRFVGGVEALPSALDHGAVPPNAAAWMGYLGLLPFLAGMVGMWANVPGSAAWLGAYGAVILAFVGAIHWGSEARRGSYRSRGYVLSVLPALVGWVGVLLPPGIGLPLLGIAFPAWRIVECYVLDAQQPGWLTRLRSRLTLGATFSLLVGAAALLFW